MCRRLTVVTASRDGHEDRPIDLARGGRQRPFLGFGFQDTLIGMEPRRKSLGSLSMRSREAFCGVGGDSGILVNVRLAPGYTRISPRYSI